VNAYRKLQRRLGAPPPEAPPLDALEADGCADDEREAAAAQPPPARADAGAPAQRKAGKPKFNALEAAAKRQAAERRAADDAAAAAQQAQLQRQRQREEAQHARRRTAEAMRKRNARGQPVMRHRVDAILAKLQAEMGAGPLRR